MLWTLRPIGVLCEYILLRPFADDITTMAEFISLVTTPSYVGSKFVPILGPPQDRSLHHKLSDSNLPIVSDQRSSIFRTPFRIWLTNMSLNGMVGQQ
jgi:hypothetical protein